MPVTTVTAMQSFYASSLGHYARQSIQNTLSSCYDIAKGKTVMGLGYTLPYMKPLVYHSACCFAFMPAEQGVSIWPKKNCVATALVTPSRLPLPDSSIDLIFMVHFLEQTENAEACLKELWRVLMPNGQLFFVVPNKWGVWAYVNFSPFGRGKSYSQYQISKLLEKTGFSCTAISKTLYIPPYKNRHSNTFSRYYEQIMHSFFNCCGCGGALVVEAKKQIYYDLTIPKRIIRHVYLPVTSLTNYRKFKDLRKTTL